MFEQGEMGRGYFLPFCCSWRTDMRPGAVLFSTLALLVLWGCSTSSIKPHSGLIERLRNRGPVALSSENPFLAGNLLISKEMENSPEMAGFVRHRGAPSAIEVEREMFSPLLIHFYYPDSREQFTLEDVDGTWVIRGPLVVPRDKMKQIATLTRNQSGEPQLAATPGREALTEVYPHTEPTSGAGYLPSEARSTEAAKDPFIERLEAAERARRQVDSSAFRSPAMPKEPTPAPETYPPARAMIRDSAYEEGQFVKDLLSGGAASDAELSPRGDLVHYVTYPGETLSIIARWYTFDRDNANRIARINRLTNPNVLSIGDQIVVPSYMLKNKSRLSEQAVRAYIARH